MLLLDDLIARLAALPEEERKVIEAAAEDAVKGMAWIPNPGPQTEAYFSEADVMLYGGQGGGGKTDLGIGLAFTAHQRSLLMRRRYANLAALTERAIKINGSRTGYSGSPPPLLRTSDGRYIQFGANQHAGDEEDWQGQPFDLKYFDEATQFLESQIRFHLGWLRSTDPNQRCRAVLGTNPPMDANGDWIVKMFGPWLDIANPKPAKHGELRWFITPDGLEDIEIPEKELHRDEHGRRFAEVAGKKLYASSRTFIPAALKDNPYLINTDYQSRLDGLPEPIRSAVRDGNFMAARKDADFQVIPTQWIIEAQARWRPDGWKKYAMTAMAFDPAGGGRDSAELAFRHGGWYGQLVSCQGEQTADGSLAAARIIQHRRDNAPVIVDAGGGAGHGFGGTTIMRLKDNGVPVQPFNGAKPSTAKTKDQALAFANMRAEAWWRFREELNPDQEGGSAIALPPDAELKADLAAPTYTVTAKGILLEDKDEIRKRIGRSPGRGDAVVMCLSPGNKAVKRQLSSSAGRAPRVVLGYAKAKGR